MLNHSQSPVVDVVCDVVDLAEGMSDLVVEQESDGEGNNNIDDTKDTSKPRKKKKKRGNRRVGKGKKAQDLEKLNKLQDGEVDSNARHDGTYDSPWKGRTDQTRVSC
jgi:hypothetical protein